MQIDLGDLNAFLAVARAKGFRDGARAIGGSASGLSEAVRRLETQLGVRLLNRTTRSVVPTEAGQRLLERLEPALTEVQSALDVVNGFRDKFFASAGFTSNRYNDIGMDGLFDEPVNSLDGLAAADNRLFKIVLFLNFLL